MISAFKVVAFEEPIARLGSHQLQLADALAEFIYTEYAALDLIIITGDLATTGSEVDLSSAADYIRVPCQSKWWTSQDAPSLNSGDLDIFLLPGNHDRYRDDSGNAAGTNFDVVFQAYWPRNSRVNTFRLEMPDGEQLAIVAVDFCLRRNSDSRAPSAKNRWGRGRAYPDTIATLVAETRRLYDRGCTAVMWATHFPPRPPQRCSSLALIKENNLILAARECNVRYIFAGHIHRKEHYRVGIGNIEVLCAASSIAVSQDKNQIHVITVEVRDGTIASLKCDDHIYDLQSQSFINVPST
jgi:DNA repair exonuclease SbcCD nuclease subunit